MREIDKIIGYNIRAFRAHANLTQHDVIEQYEVLTGVKISKSMMSMWENGDRRIYADQLWVISCIIDTEPNNLFPNITPEKLQKEEGIVNNMKGEI